MGYAFRGFQESADRSISPPLKFLYYAYLAYLERIKTAFKKHSKSNETSRGGTKTMKPGPGKTGALLLLAAAVLFGGCTGGEADGSRGIPNYGARNANNYGSKRHLPPEGEGSTAYGSHANGSGIHGNTRLVYSQKLSNEVGSLYGVNSAFVFLTDTSAYAAVLIDNTATGTRGGKSTRETNNSGTGLGRYNPHNFGQRAERGKIATGFNNYYTVEDHQNLSHAFKQLIAETIRRSHPPVHNVYISANRDFINRMNLYAIESWKGNPIDGYVGEFNVLANRVFGAAELPADPAK
jgi:YhcN/YlaJ family sporulation lipoprotein